MISPKRCATICYVFNPPCCKDPKQSEAEASHAQLLKIKKRNMLKARLRRQCEKKPNGKLLVPVWVHDMWRTGNKDELAEKLEECNFDKASFLHCELYTLSFILRCHKCMHRTICKMSIKTTGLIPIFLLVVGSRMFPWPVLHCHLSGRLRELLQEDPDEEGLKETKARGWLVHEG